MTQKHVFIALPAYAGTVHVGTTRAIFGEILMLTDRGDRVTWEDLPGSADIETARAYFIAKCLESDATHLIFVDHDVHWEPGALMKLVDAPVDLVAAMYPQRRDPPNYSVRWVNPGGELWADLATGLLEAEGVPAGCLRMTRSMLEKMVAAYPDSEFFYEQAPNGRAWHLFEKYRLPSDRRMLLSEDFSFCMRWRDIGGQVWIDPEITMGHIGNKAFIGKFGDWLRNRPVEQPQKKAA